MKAIKKTHWLRNTICILIICVIIGLILSLVLFAKDHNRTFASAKLSFTFDGAQDGLAPNGYGFDVNELVSEAIITNALENAGMTDRYSVETIQQNLAVQGVYPEDLVTQMTRYNSLTDASSSQTLTLSEYHPTVFNVTLYKDFDPSISKGDLVTLLDNILISYRTLYAQKYAMGLVEYPQQGKLEDYDYFQQLELMQFRLTQAKGYAEEMFEKDMTLRVGGKDFSDMALQFDSMITGDMSRLNATMTMNALSKDLERLKDQYGTEIQDLQDKVKIQTQLMNNLDILISVYGKSGIIYLSTSDSFNKVDSQSSKFYDQLVDIRNEISSGIAELNNQIANYQNKLDELKSGEIKSTVDDVLAAAEDAAEEDSTKQTAAENAPDAEVVLAEDELMSQATSEQKKAVLEAGITRLTDKSVSAMESLNEMLKTYNEQEINDLSVVQSSIRYKAPSIFSGTFIVLAIKTIGPICALGLMLSLVLIIISRRKEQKANSVK